MTTSIPADPFLTGDPVVEGTDPAAVVDLVEAGLPRCDRTGPHARHEFVRDDHDLWCAGIDPSPEDRDRARTGAAAVRALIDPATGRTHDHRSLR